MNTAQCKNEIVKYCSVSANSQRLKQEFNKFNGNGMFNYIMPTYTTLVEWKRYKKVKLGDIQCGYLKVPNKSVMRKFSNNTIEYLTAMVVSDH
jgi:hypothetical protein